jgi:hypothetical protein
MTALETLQSQLEPGRVYRRSDLEKYSNAVDRHVKQLQKNGVLKKLSGGLYYFPRMTKFGAAPPTDQELVKGFLKDDRFLLTYQNSYELYPEALVYNHKRHGIFKLGSRMFRFVVKKHLK